VIVAVVSSVISFFIDVKFGIFGVLLTFLVALFASASVKDEATAEVLGGVIASAIVYLLASQFAKNIFG